ncbi:hypothetical protein AXF42_Ash019015 [Apostasia shenzhenica]|uniref:Uncharacterized protein n=1 Tax=Apostasia shenzhenica TaxID=1088818 RepID=A0A2I0AC34_9ASPA|nr:hypothetical protein AXF42_Ash019015 [Apostasia shenzhenica]
MGASESIVSKAQHQQPPIDDITTVSERIEGTDPVLEQIRALKIATPLLRSPLPSESTLTDILVRNPSSSSSSVSGSLNPNVLLELFSMYREWQEEEAKKISQKQEEIENKIETADALAAKLLQRFNYSVSSMRKAADELAQVNQLQIEVGELKGRLTEVISNCDALCKRIEADGPESLLTSVVHSSGTVSSSENPSSSNKLVRP